jgi:hypothetical protein
MISDEGQFRAACEMVNAAQQNLRAANLFSESVQQLGFLLGQGYGKNLEILIEELKKIDAARKEGK